MVIETLERAQQKAPDVNSLKECHSNSRNFVSHIKDIQYLRGSQSALMELERKELEVKAYHKLGDVPPEVLKHMGGDPEYRTTLNAIREAFVERWLGFEDVKLLCPEDELKIINWTISRVQDKDLLEEKKASIMSALRPAPEKLPYQEEELEMVIDRSLSGIPIEDIQEEKRKSMISALRPALALDTAQIAQKAAYKEAWYAALSQHLLINDAIAVSKAAGRDANLKGLSLMANDLFEDKNVYIEHSTKRMSVWEAGFVLVSVVDNVFHI
jgi:hypothetical protein